MNKDINEETVGENKSPLHRHVFAVAVFCVGVILSVAMFAVVRNWEQNQIWANFERDAEDCISAVKREMQSHLLITESLGAFLGSSDELSEENIRMLHREFQAFMAALLSPSPSR